MAENRFNRNFHQRDSDDWKNDKWYGRDRNQEQSNDDYNQINFIPDNDQNRGYNDGDYGDNQSGNSGSFGYRGTERNPYMQSQSREDWNEDRGYDTKWQDRMSGRNDGGWDKEYSGRRNYNDYDSGNNNRQQRNYGEVYQGNPYDRERRAEDDYDRLSGHYDRRSRSGNRDNEDRRQGRDDNNWWDKTKDEVSSWFDGDDDQRRDDRRGRDRDERISGPHRGKGPKGYERASEKILEEVCDRLSDDDKLDASYIEIKVEGSEVVLDGKVEDREGKRRAEDLVESIKGVSHVQNNLRVSPVQGTPTTNGIIAAVSEHNNPTYANQIDKDKNRDRR